MKKIPSKYILSIKPKEYLKQGLSHCGAYSTKAILSAFGKDSKNDPREYHTFWLNKLLGTGLWNSYWVNVLCSYGLKASTVSAHKLNDQEKLILLKSLLSENNPVMILIKNGYLSGGRYSSLQAIYMPHWVTLWGYSDQEEVFYLYDSAVSPEDYDKDIKIGNKKRTYKEVLRDWQGTFFEQIFWNREYFYIKIES